MKMDLSTGKNIFRFDRGSLADGVYPFKVVSNNGLNHHGSFVIRQSK
jgi:hypothetical protein